jgi:hypothetical protein
LTKNVKIKNDTFKDNLLTDLGKGVNEGLKCLYKDDIPPVERAEGMLAAIISAKSLGFERVYFPFDSTIPIHLFQNIDCIVVQHVEERLWCPVPTKDKQ